MTKCKHFWIPCQSVSTGWGSGDFIFCAHCKRTEDFSLSDQAKLSHKEEKDK